MSDIKKLQQLALAAMLALQLALLFTGKLYVASVLPPLLFSVPVGYLAYQSMTISGASLPIPRTTIMVALMFCLVSMTGFILPSDKDPRMWMGLPILTDAAVLFTVAIVMSYLYGRRRKRFPIGDRLS